MDDAILFEECSEAARRKDAFAVCTHDGWPACLMKLEAQFVHNLLCSRRLCELKVDDIP